MSAPWGMPEGRDEGIVDEAVEVDDPPQPETARAIAKATTVSEAALTAAMDLRMLFLSCGVIWTRRAVWSGAGGGGSTRGAGLPTRA